MFLPTTISMLFTKLLWILTLTLLPWSLFLILNNKIIIMEWQFMALNLTPLNFSILNDPKSVLFSCAVFIISANVLHFSNTYMKEEMFINRFTILVLMFILSMNLLLYIPNMMALLLGWDGLGLVSFLLVAYYQKPGSWGAAMITALSNRIGDVMILLSIAWSLNQGHWNILSMHHNNFSNMLIISIMIAGMTKSAQIPFSAWLPAAMAAPTPVSALVHSSTLVTAGVFLLIRFYPMLKSYYIFNISLTLIASLTMLMASLAAMTETDMKKIIALSTLSQLGIMMATIGLNMPLLAFFHLLTHALFKALLFICAGSLIHYYHHSQDLRHMGNALMQMPMSASAMTTASLALAGAPYLAGFYSKDMILEFTMFSTSNFIIMNILIFSTLLTTMYSVRLIYITTFNMNNFQPLHNINNSEYLFPAMALSLGAIFAGAMMNWFFLTPIEEPILAPQMKQLPIYMFLSMVTLTLMLMNNLTLPLSINSTIKMNPTNMIFSLAMSSMWFLTPISANKISPNQLMISHTLLKTIDNGWVEMTSSMGLKSFAQYLMTTPNKLLTNSLTTHLMMSIMLMIPMLLLI